MKISGFMAGIVAVVGLSVVGLQDAEAKRFGGGKSFGSRPSHSTPFKRSTTPTRPSQRQQAAQQQNAQRQAQLANRGGMWGMLGGLALGGLLGALFFGGAFENLNFLDIAIFALIAFLLYRLFAARARRSVQQAGGGAAPGVGASVRNEAAQRAADPDAESGRDWGLDSDAMQRKFGAGESPAAAVDEPETGGHSGAGDEQMPPDFDERGFLEGAERAYRLFQEAWDRGDLDEIERFTTPSVFAEVRAQLQERRGENRTDVLSLDTQVLEARQVGTTVEVSVLFDAILREVDDSSGPGERGQQIREVWHFVRSSDAATPTWYLDGIQQLEH